MTHQRILFIESTCVILGCTSEEFWDVYESDKLSTDVLSEDVLTKVVGINQERLRAAEQRYRLDDLLSGMIIHAPHSLGQRYVAVSLHLANNKGEDAVINLAKAWMEQLFLPMLAISKVTKSEPNSHQTPKPEDSEFRNQLARREKSRCAFTGSFDIRRREALFQHGRQAEAPPPPYALMGAAHIIPFSLNDFGEKKIGLEISDAAYTRDMFNHGPKLTFRLLQDQTSTLRQTASTCRLWNMRLSGTLSFIWTRMRLRTVRPAVSLTSGECEADVEFQSLAESGVESPNPIFIRVHAAFAKVINLCGVGLYLQNLEEDWDDCGFLRENGETDVASLLMTRLTIATRTQV